MTKKLLSVNPLNLLLLITFSLSFISNSYSQINKIDRPFSISFGINFIDNNGDHNPFSIISESEAIAFSTPLELIFGYKMSPKFEAIAGLSFNKFKEGQNVDNIDLEEDISYSAVDVGIRYFPIIYEINRSSDISFFTQAGFGVYSVDSSQATANIGFGAIYNLNNEFGFYMGSNAKFSLDNERLNSNLFQHSMGVRLKLFNNCSCSIFK